MPSTQFKTSRAEALLGFRNQLLQENEELLNKEELDVNETLKLLLRRTAAISTPQFDLQLRYEHNASIAEQTSQQYSDIIAAFKD